MDSEVGWSSGAIEQVVGGMTKGLTVVAFVFDISVNSTILAVQGEEYPDRSCDSLTLVFRSNFSSLGRRSGGHDPRSLELLFLN